MKKVLFLTLALLSFNAAAVPVVASGEGYTCEEALINAKIAAVDKVNGTWLHGNSYVRDNLFKEKITTYNGGVVKSYKVLKDDCKYVIIEADVVPQSNKVQANSANVPADMFTHMMSKSENQSKLSKAAEVLNDRSKALAFKISNVEYQYKGISTLVIIHGDLTLQEKWVNDYISLKKEAEFDLPVFDKPLMVNVKGFDTGKELTDNSFRIYDDQNLEVYNYRRELAIYPDKKDTIKLSFLVNTSKLKDVNEFVVSFK